LHGFQFCLLSSQSAFISSQLFQPAGMPSFVAVPWCGSVVKKACLLVCYLAMDFLYCHVLLYSLPSNGLFTKLSLLERVCRAVA
jgi:hypothetical protein